MNHNEIFASCIMSELHNEADLSKSCEYCKELADFSEAISSIISLADDGGIELRNYDSYPF